MNPLIQPRYQENDPKAIVGRTKPPMDAIPPVSILLLGQAMKDGKEKYGPMNWRNSEVVATTYYNAILRHLLAWFDGESVAEDSGTHHLAHIMAGCAILLDAMQSGTLEDDRPVTPGKTSDLIHVLTKETTTT